ncbi:MAG: hypothetical protein ACYDC3_06280 [Candidatus Binataceae bacterium]
MQFRRTGYLMGAAMLLAMAQPAFAQNATPASAPTDAPSAGSSPPVALQPNQTAGFGAGKVLTFTYTQNFDCVDQPLDDLNFNGIPAESDPAEMQIPICQVGIQPTIGPPNNGNPLNSTEPLYVLVPMFSVNNDKNPNDAISCTGVVPGTACGPALGSFLISAFGSLPEGFKETPAVYTQCPDPNSPPGTCTMHASRLDLAPALAALGLIPKPPTANVFVPTPNHSHIVLNGDVRIKPIWWQVDPVLVMDASDWPPEDGSSGITSYKELKAAEKAGTAIEVPSNFYLFFSSMKMGQKLPKKK